MQSTNKNRHWLVWTITATLWAGATSLQAALITFSFNGAAGNEVSLAPDAQPTGAFVSDMTRGGGLNPSNNANTFSATGWTTNPNRDDADFFSFSITPDAGQMMSLTSMELDERRSGTGVRQWSVFSSLDGYSAALANFAVPDDTNTRTGQTIGLDGSFSGLAGAVEFRIYGFEAEASGGTWRIDNVKLFGLLAPQSTAVPDAGSSLALFGLALVGLGWLGRRFVR